MLTGEDILGLLNGTLTPDERARVAAELARDPEAAQRAFGPERLAVLAVLLRTSTPAPALVTTPPPAAKPVSGPELSADEALGQALREAGKGGWAYRPAPGERGPGLGATLAAALREWSCTWHARVLMLGLALGLAFAVFILLKSRTLKLEHPRPDPGVASPTTNRPPTGSQP
jgi:anti-sigma factor RsiW